MFSWVADNVPPTIVSLTPSATTVLAGADVTWTAVATDPGIDDTFMWWFDGGAGVPGGLTTTYTTRASQFSLSESVNVCVGGRKNQLNASTHATAAGTASAMPQTMAIGSTAKT